eukprot:jgi/Undpi1/1722/HiC_scaffold_11.g05112.m1
MIDVKCRGCRKLKKEEGTCTGKAHCHYRQKQPTKSQLKAAAAPKQKVSSGAKRPVRPTQLGPGGDMVATPYGRTSGISSVLSLKRCRLSPSPATGLVGMQENAFLNDYFDCLGFLPLANERMVRQAVVQIMLGPNPQQRHDGFRAGPMLAEGEEGEFHPEGERGGWGQALAHQESTSCPSKCILWCAIALGALVQGCSLEYVTGYLKLARDSLAECFDGNTIDTARAYLVMAFLHSFMGDKEKSQKHLLFAKSIMERLPRGMVPSWRGGVVLICCLPQSFDRLSRVRSRQNAILLPKLHLVRPSRCCCRCVMFATVAPQMAEIVHEKDLCNLFLLTDRRLNRAFFEDMRSKGVVANAKKNSKEALDEGMENAPEELLEHGGEFGREEGPPDLEGGGALAPPRSSFFVNEGVKKRICEDPPPSGAATKTFIKDVLPELERISRVIERSGACSGVGGLFYHGNIAYMKAVKGEVDSAFESIKFCARLVEISDVDFAALGWIWTDQGCVAPTLGVPPASVRSAPVTGQKSRRPIDITALEAQPVEAQPVEASAAAGAGKTVAVSPRFASAVADFPPATVSPSPPPTSAQESPQHRDDVAAREEVQPGAIAEVTSPAALEAGRLDAGTGRHQSAGTITAESGFRAESLGPGSEQEGVGLPRVLLSGDEEDGGAQTGVITPAVTSNDPAVLLVGDKVRCDDEVDAFGVPNDVPVVDNIAECDLAFVGEEGQGADIGLTDADLMAAAEVLLGSDLLDEELGEEAIGCL